MDQYLAKPKKKRTRLTIGDKKNLISDAESGTLTRPALAAKWKIGERTVFDILKNKNKILASTRDNFKKIDSGVKLKSFHTQLLQKIKFLRSSSLRLPITLDTIIILAQNLRQDLLKPGAEIPPTEREELVHWEPSTRQWAKRFVKRNGMESITVHGTGNDVDMNDAELLKKIDIIKAKLAEYDLESIYNVDEFALFYRCLPNRTFITSDEDKKTVRGSKQMKSKERLTGFACTNATGTSILPIGVIGKSKQPRAFTAAGVGRATNRNRWRGCPLPYFSQKNAWSDKHVMREWFQTVFLPHVHAKEQKVLLLLDNCGCHESGIGSVFYDPKGLVETIMLPPNTTSKLQPMDAGIIAWIKRQYKYFMLTELVKRIERWEELRKQGALKTAGCKGIEDAELPNVFDALKMMRTVQSKMSQKTVIKCWLKCDIFTEAQSEQLKQLLGSHQPTSDSNDDALSCDEITAALSNLKLNMDSNNDGYQVKSNETVFTSAIVAIKETQELLLNAGNKESTARVLDDWCAMEESREIQQHLLLELTEDEQIENISSEDQVAVIGDEKESPVGELRNVVQALQDLPSYLEDKIAGNRRITWTNSRAQVLNTFRPLEALLETMEDVPPEFRSSLARPQKYVQQGRGAKMKQSTILHAFRNTNTST